MSNDDSGQNFQEWTLNIVPDRGRIYLLLAVSATYVIVRAELEGDVRAP